MTPRLHLLRGTSRAGCSSSASFGFICFPEPCSSLCKIVLYAASPGQWRPRQTRKMRLHGLKRRTAAGAHRYCGPMRFMPIRETLASCHTLLSEIFSLHPLHRRLPASARITAFRLLVSSAGVLGLWLQRRCSPSPPPPSLLFLLCSLAATASSSHSRTDM